MTHKKELWSKLKSYHFDHLVPTLLWQHIAANFDGSNAFSKAFASKIARKHGWKNLFALKALDEYKKFVYLGIISDFQVTPSKVIDIVWHEHLLFTKGYRQFCSEVIKYEFDHYPELVPITQQTEQFNAQYLQTLDLYRTEFNSTPPAEIWEITKYDKEKLVKKNGQPTRKKDEDSFSYNPSTYTAEAPLYTFFSDSTNAGVSNTEFGNGEFGGAGASGSWSNPVDSSSNSDSGSDSSSSGGSDGGSSCSSGCGGGD